MKSATGPTNAALPDDCRAHDLPDPARRNGVARGARNRVAGGPLVDGTRTDDCKRPPFADLRILELTNVLAGPFCAYQLAMLGAEVIKIEMPETGDLARELGADETLNQRKMGASFLAQNAGKRSVTINLVTEEGKRVFLRLVETAHVVVENFRPGVMSRLGLSYDDLKRVNPKLIYCAISGYGQEGPLRSAPAYDQIVQGMSGLMSVSGDEATAPLRVGCPIADTVGGITAAFAIASALVRLVRYGEGSFIDVSLLDSTLVTMGWVLSNYLIADQMPRPMGNDNFTAAPSGTFRTGRGLLNVAANKQDQFEALARALDLASLIADERFADRQSRRRNRTELTREIEQALMKRTAEEWEAILMRAGVPAGRVLNVREALDHPQIAARKLIKTLEAPAGLDRPIKLMLAGFKMAGADPDVASPPPFLGEHTEEVLRDAGYGQDEIEALRKASAI